jgi:hypothetical protein
MVGLRRRSYRLICWPALNVLPQHVVPQDETANDSGHGGTAVVELLTTASSTMVMAGRRPRRADGLIGSSVLGGTGRVAALVTDPVKKCKIEHMECDEANLAPLVCRPGLGVVELRVCDIIAHTYESAQGVYLLTVRCGARDELVVYGVRVDKVGWDGSVRANRSHESLYGAFGLPPARYVR